MPFTPEPAHPSVPCFQVGDITVMGVDDSWAEYSHIEAVSPDGRIATARTTINERLLPEGTPLIRLRATPTPAYQAWVYDAEDEFDETLDWTSRVMHRPGVDQVDPESPRTALVRPAAWGSLESAVARDTDAQASLARITQALADSQGNAVAVTTAGGAKAVRTPRRGRQP